IPTPTPAMLVSILDLLAPVPRPRADRSVALLPPRYPGAARVSREENSVLRSRRPRRAAARARDAHAAHDDRPGRPQRAGGFVERGSGRDDVVEHEHAPGQVAAGAHASGDVRATGVDPES